MRQLKRKPCRAGEEGFVLLVVVFLIAMLILALSVAIPRVTNDLQRDRELETMHRGRQYIRAIQLYYRRFHTYPPNLDALVDTNGIRFLRKRYNDPITGQDDWRVIGMGQNRAPMSLGFFGESLDGSGAINGSGTNGMLGTVSLSSGNPAGNPGNGGDASSQFFGGEGVIGVAPGSPRSSILIYKTKEKYDDWEFVYDPRADWSIRGFQPIQLPQPPVNTGSPGFNQGNNASSTSAQGSSSH